MSDQLWRFIALLGAVAVGIGLYLGFTSIQVSALPSAENCGSAFTASGYNGEAGSLVVAECDSSRHSRQEVTVPLLIAGLVIGGYAVSQSTLRMWVQL